MLLVYFFPNEFHVYQLNSIYLFLLIFILGCHYAILIGIIPASQIVKFGRESFKNKFVHFLVLLNLSFENVREITEILSIQTYSDDKEHSYIYIYIYIYIHIYIYYKDRRCVFNIC